MFFVMSLGILVVYFVMGWSTNSIAQVRELLCFWDNPLYSIA